VGKKGLERRVNGKSLLIRVDASPSMGIGHVMRCIAIAQEWKDQGGEAIFLTAMENDKLSRRISDEGFQTILMKNPHPHPEDRERTLQLSHQLGGNGNVWIVVDGHHFDPVYQSALRSAGCRLLVLDDMAHQPEYHADILLNQNINANGIDYRCDPDTRLLLGTRFALLRKEFLRFRKRQRKIPAQVRRILITLGGSDPDNVARKVIQALSPLDIGDIKLEIIAGPVNMHLNELSSELEHSSFAYELMTEVSDMSSLMADADLAISAGGSTCWELAFMGVPFMIIILAKNQEGAAIRLHDEGVALNCGWFNTFSRRRFSDDLSRMISAPELRESFSRKARRLVDGFGAERLIKCMVPA
jgi:UDP-2,4-diacetamido-2,4,6-trideoxy-beta-L-altropyranose hydrolase